LALELLRFFAEARDGWRVSLAGATPSILEQLMLKISDGGAERFAPNALGIDINRHAQARSP